MTAKSFWAETGVYACVFFLPVDTAVVVGEHSNATPTDLESVDTGGGQRWPATPMNKFLGVGQLWPNTPPTVTGGAHCDPPPGVEGPAIHRGGDEALGMRPMAEPFLFSQTKEMGNQNEVQTK